MFVGPTIFVNYFKSFFIFPIFLFIACHTSELCIYFDYAFISIREHEKTTNSSNPSKAVKYNLVIPSRNLFKIPFIQRHTYCQCFIAFTTKNNQKKKKITKFSVPKFSIYKRKWKINGSVVKVLLSINVPMING